MTTTTDVALRGEALEKVYRSGQIEVHALRGVDVEVTPGQLVCVTGPSGSGKTTLLNLLGGLDRPTAGRVVLGDGRVLSEMSEKDVLATRRDDIGYVFQSFGLLPLLSAAENVEVPLRLRRTPSRERDKQVQEMLTLVGLGRHSHQRPGELSGGQQQRVGIARALVTRPKILLADEPTGQLDGDTATAVTDLMCRLVKDEGLAAVIATHDPELERRADVTLRLGSH